MKLNDVGMVVASRELNLPAEKKVTVTIGKPEKLPDAEDYYCPYLIAGIGGERVRYAGGVDAVQALELAFKMIGTDLYTSQEAQAKELTKPVICWANTTVPVVSSRRRSGWAISR
jgi:hypothetical protein